MKKGTGGEVNAFLDKDSSLEGEITVPQTVRIDGKMKGKITAGEEVIIGPLAEVDAVIEAEVVCVSGRVSGKIKARQRLEIYPDAHVTSDVVTRSIRLDDGSVFQGHCEMSPGKIE